MFDQFREIQSSLDSFEVIWSCQTLQGALRFQGVWQKGKGRLAFTISLWLWATHISAFPTPQFLSGEGTAVPHFQLLQAVTSSNDRAPQTKLWRAAAVPLCCTGTNTGSRGQQLKRGDCVCRRSASGSPGVHSSLHTPHHPHIPPRICQCPPPVHLWPLSRWLRETDQGICGSPTVPPTNGPTHKNPFWNVNFAQGAVPDIVVNISRQKTLEWLYFPFWRWLMVLEAGWLCWWRNYWLLVEWQQAFVGPAKVW